MGILIWISLKGYQILHFIALGCGIATKTQLDTKGKERSQQDIQKLKALDEQWNEGLYERATILKKSTTSSFEFFVPLKLLNRFFSLNMMYPQKKLMVCVLNLNTPAKMFIKPDTMTSKYTLEITAANLIFNYYCLESNFRSQYYSLINERSLTRVLKYQKQTHFNVPKNTQVLFLPNIILFGMLPESLVIHFVSEKNHLGSHSNRFAFHHYGLKSIELFVNGQNHNKNQFTRDMDLNDRWSLCVRQWYESFLAVFPKSAREIPLQVFHDDMFLFCYDLYPKDSHHEYQDLSLLTSGTCDVNLCFSKQLDTDLIMYVQSTHSKVYNFGAMGEFLND